MSWIFPLSQRQRCIGTGPSAITHYYQSADPLHSGKHNIHIDVYSRILHIACRCSPMKALNVTLIARFMGPTWGPPGAERNQVGPRWATWTLLSGYGNDNRSFNITANATKYLKFITSIVAKWTLLIFTEYDSRITLVAVIQNTSMQCSGGSNT